MPREYLLLTQCLRGFLYGLNPIAQPSQAFALQYSFFLRTSRLDTCLRRAGLLGSDAPPQKCKPINRSADSGGLATAFGWRPKASVVPTLDLDRPKRIDPSAVDRACAGTVITFSRVGFNERSVSWRQHAGNSAGLSRACAPHYRFRQARFADHENHPLLNSKMLSDRR